MRYLLGSIVISAALVLNACAPPSRSIPIVPTPSETLPASPTATFTIVWFPPTSTFTPLPSLTSNPNPTQDQRAQHGELIFQDDFSQPDLWSSGKGASGNIAFGKGEISLGVSKPEGYLASLRAGPPLNDFFLEITASPSICRAGDEYGVIFRASSPADFFRFGLNCRGEARLDRVLSGSATAAQAPKLSGAIPPGAPSVSRLGIWAFGKEMRFYVNGEYLFTVRDPSILNGVIGLYARAGGAEAMTVNFSDLSVYHSMP